MSGSSWAAAMWCWCEKARETVRRRKMWSGAGRVEAAVGEVVVAAVVALAGRKSVPVRSRLWAMAGPMRAARKS